MGRNRRRKHARRRAAERRKSLEELEREMAASPEGMPVGMSYEQALALAHSGAQQMARRLGQEGLAGPAPWGGLLFDHGALRQTINNGLLMLQAGEAAIDRCDDSELSTRDAVRMLADTASGAITLAAASILYLASSPISYEVARHVTSRRVDATGTVEDD